MIFLCSFIRVISYGGNGHKGVRIHFGVLSIDILKSIMSHEPQRLAEAGKTNANRAGTPSTAFWGAG